jgi:hypothetical protein
MLLEQVPAPVRFVSLEPQLSHVNCGEVLGHGKVNWVIVGGESGPGARPFETDWARSVIAQCKASGTACFVKQLGANPLLPIKTILHPPQRRTMKLKHRKGGLMDEWPADLRIREFPDSQGAANPVRHKTKHAGKLSV